MTAELLKYEQKKKKEAKKEITYIKTESIMPNRSQPRNYFDQQGLDELTESIRKYGILQPLTIRINPEKNKFSHFQYELIAGERRLRASKLLGIQEVPCIIMESDTKTSATLAIIENLHRKDLNVFEEASAIAALMEIHDLTQEQVAEKLSLTQAAVANKLRLLRLTETEKALISENSLTERHARALLRVKTVAKRLEILSKVIERGMNVKQTEEYVEAYLSLNEPESNTMGTPPRLKALDTRALIRSIEKAVEFTRNNGTRIKTQQTETDSEIVLTISIPK